MKETVVVGMYADQVYTDWWDNEAYYGDDNSASVVVKKSDLDEWLKENKYCGFASYNQFMDEYVYDDTDGFFRWLKENGKYYEVLTEG